MRNLFPCLALLASVALAVSVGAAIFQIEDDDPRVIYNTAVLPQSSCAGVANSSCTGVWWIEHRNGESANGVHDTYGPGTNATLQFQGTSIAVFGVQYDTGAQAVITLDGQQASAANFHSSNGAFYPSFQVFTSGQLDPTVNHTIVVAYDDTFYAPNARSWLGLDFFRIATAHETITSSPQAQVTAGIPPLFISASGSGAAQSASSTSALGYSSSPSVTGGPGSSPATETSSTSGHKISPGAAAGIVVGCFVFLGSLGALTWAWLRRRRRAAKVTMHSKDSHSMPTPYFATPYQPTSLQETPFPATSHSPSSPTYSATSPSSPITLQPGFLQQHGSFSISSAPPKGARVVAPPSDGSMPAVNIHGEGLNDAEPGPPPYIQGS